MKKLIAMLMALVLCFGLVACGGSSDNSADNSADAAATIKLGCTGPITGGAAIYGQAVKNGMAIAIEEVNALGGLQFEMLYEDDVNDVETATNAYNKLVDDGMQILAGPVTSNPGIALAKLAMEDSIFGLTPSASSPDVVADSDSMFQVCFTDPNQGSGSATYIKGNMPDAKVAVIYKNDDAYSTGIRDTFVSQAATEGLNIVYEGTFTDATATDFSVQLTAAQAAGADLVFLPIYYTPASVILAQADAMGYEPTFFGVDGMDGILGMEGFNTELAEGVMLLTPFAADAQDELTQNFVAKYQKLYGEVPNQFAADAYDGVYIIYNLLVNGGATADMSAAELCEICSAEILNLTFTGVTGANMTWSANGEVSKMPLAVVITEGVYVLA